jgi:hypothetical protein
MTHLSPILSDQRIVDAMIALARAAKSARIIVAGPNSSAVFLALHHRGYPRVTTTKACRVPCGQHDVALVTWRDHSITALETTLDQLVHFLSAGGVLAHQTFRPVLQKLGFRIEAGTCCENGVAISARRLESTPVAKVA